MEDYKIDINEVISIRSEGLITTGFTSGAHRYQHSDFNGTLVFQGSAKESWVFVGDHHWHHINSGRSGRSGTFAKYDKTSDSLKIQIFQPIITFNNASSNPNIELIVVPGTIAAFSILQRSKFDGGSYQTIIEGSNLRLLP